MQEISLHILDLAQNAIRAGAHVIQIEVLEDAEKDTLTVCITDDGRGMSPSQLTAAADPFYTSRTTRKVGLGIPLFKMAAEMTGGSFEIVSQAGKGTAVCGRFVRSHIDRMPLGDMNATLLTLIACNPQLDFVYRRVYGRRSFCLDTRQVRRILAGVPLNASEVLCFLKEYLAGGEEEILQA